MMETNIGDARNAEVETLDGGKRESHQIRATLSPESKKAPVNHDVMSQKENRSSEDGNEYSRFSPPNNSDGRSEKEEEEKEGGSKEEESVDAETFVKKGVKRQR